MWQVVGAEERPESVRINEDHLFSASKTALREARRRILGAQVALGAAMAFWIRGGSKEVWAHDGRTDWTHLRERAGGEAWPAFPSLF